MRHSQSHVLGKYWLIPTQEQSLSNTFLELCQDLALNTFYANEKQTAPFPLSRSRVPEH